MSRFWLTVAASLLSMAVFADVREGHEMNAVSVPYTDWELRFPSEGWQLNLQRSAPDGRQYSYMFSNFRQRLIVSFILEPAYKCETGEACRNIFWKNPGPAYENPKEGRFLESNRFSVVEFTTVTNDLEQRHWSGHWVNDGVRIHLHVSVPSALARDFSGLQAFTEQLAIAPKPFCTGCLQLNKGLSRQAAMILFSKARAGDARAWRQLQTLARSGDAEAQFMAARMYSWGSPLLRSDEKQSVFWSAKAAEQGHAEAQSNLGYFMASGRGVEKRDIDAAVMWWTRAADQGFAAAQLNLASLYANEPALKDDAKSFEWLHKAAERGLAAAQLNLGVRYARGIGAPRDLKKALEWYGKAAEQGDEAAMVNAAEIYGLGTQDRPLIDTALGILGRPLLSADERAKTLRARICGDNPGACPDLSQKNTPPDEAPGKKQ
jgi:TPR repeat protein